MPSWGEIVAAIQANSPHDDYRKSFLEKLYEYNDGERDVLLYSSGWTHTGFNSPRESIIDADMQGIMEAFSALDGDKLDIILHSPGGAPGAAESIVDYIRSKYNDVRIFVPHAAMSAATMVCCASDELVMGRHSFLGPIDPQITLDTPTGHRPVPAGAIRRQFQQAREDIEEDESNLAHWTPILRQYGPGLLQECEQSEELSKELAREWAQEYHLSDERNAEEQAESLAENLCDWDKFKNHNRHLNREKVREYGFKVTDLEDDDELQDIILSIYHTATLTHDQRQVAKIIETHEGNAFVAGGAPDTQVQNRQLPASAQTDIPEGPGN